ncbi:MAG: diadenylate cyclase CdaA [Terriglobia bacterium]
MAAGARQVSVGTVAPTLAAALVAFPRLTGRAVIDILLVAAVLYYFLNLIKDTRAFTMVLAAAAILLLYSFTGWAQLEALHWLLVKLIPAFVFALIVVYQAEIRRALAGTPRLIGLMGRLGSPATDPYDDIVLACSYFSQNRIGALMAIEGDISLRTYIESGIGLDAQLSYDLLVSIFRPESPLHDGAVVIRKNRVAAASCFLPLSLNPLLSAQLGTRHRAAIGVTEETDALCVVVSEQTRAIAVMHGGTVELNLTPEQLRQRLRILLGRRTRPRLRAS